MESPAIYDIVIRRGNDFERLFEFQHDDGTAMVLTDWTVQSQVRQEKDINSSLIIDFTISIPDPTDGKVYLQLTDTQTAALVVDEGYYDILLTSDADFDETYVEGRCYIKNIVTEKV